MADDRQGLREIAWQELFPGTLLLSAWKVAIQLRSVVIATLALFLMWIGWIGIDKAVGVRPKDSLAPTAWTSASLDVDAHSPVKVSAEPWLAASQVPPGEPLAWWNLSPVAQAWSELTRPFLVAFSPAATAGRFGYVLLCGLWALVVWSFAGGAITRLAAVQLAREEKLSWGHLFAYVRSKWPSYFAAPLFPIAGVLLGSIPLAILGLLVRTGGFGVAVTAILWPLVLIAGAVMALLLVGLFLNWILMWPTISTEGTDSFDALSRSFAYSFQRPLRYVAYLFVVAAIGVLAWSLVLVFASAVLSLSQWGVSWGSGHRLLELLSGQSSATGATRFGVNLIHFWNGAVTLVATAFAFSYFFSAATAVYLLLRYHIDATETDEVYLSDGDEPYGLPPLKTDAAGVVQVADAQLPGSSERVSPEG